MAQKNQFYVTAKKIITPKNIVFNYPDGKLIGVIATDEVVYFAVGTDTLFLTAAGFQITAQEDFADVNTALSATNISGS